MRIDAPARGSARPHALAAGEPLDEAAHRAAHLLDLGRAQRRERHRLRRALALPLGLGRGSALEDVAHVTAHLLARGLELSLQRGEELIGARVSERVDEARAQERQLGVRAGETEPLRDLVGGESDLGGIVETREVLGDGREREQPVELRAAVEQDAERREVAAAAHLRQHRAELVELGGREAARAEALPERAVVARAQEEAPELRLEARELRRVLHDDGSERGHPSIGVVDADELGRDRRVDGLRRRDREPRPPERPEELVEHGDEAARRAHGAGGGAGALEPDADALPTGFAGSAMSCCTSCSTLASSLGS